MPIQVLAPEIVSQIAIGEVVENDLDSLTLLEAINKLYELQNKAKEE